MKKHPEYVTMFPREMSQISSKKNNPCLEIIASNEDEYKQLEKDHDMNKNLFFWKLKTPKNDQDLISGFANYLIKNNLQKYLNRSIQNENAFICSYKNRDEYDEISRNLVYYLEGLQEQ